MKKYIKNAEYPNGAYLDLTAEELAQQETDIADATAKKQEEETAKATAEANKASAMSKLSALGLSEDEINALIK